MKDEHASQLHQLDQDLWNALDSAVGLPAVLVADSLLGCAAATCLSAGLSEEQIVQGLQRALLQLREPATLHGVPLMPVAPASA